MLSALPALRCLLRLAIAWGLLQIVGAQSLEFTTPPVDTVSLSGGPLQLRTETSTGQTACLWQHNGRPVPGLESTDISLLATTASQAGMWQCKVRHGPAGAEEYLSPLVRVDVVAPEIGPGTLATEQTLPEIFTIVRAMATDAAGRFLIAGNLGGVEKLVRLLPTGALDATFPAIQADAAILTILPTTNALWLGGKFTTLNSLPFAKLARIGVNGALTNPVATTANGTVNTIVPHLNGTIMAGGEFSTINNIIRHRLVRFSASGSVEDGFNSGPESVFNATGRSIIALAVETAPNNPSNLGRIVVGGIFDLPNRARLLRLLPSGGVDASLTAAGVDRAVRAVVVLPDSSFFAGGDFANTYNAVGQTVSQISLVRVKPDGNFDPNFQPIFTSATSFPSVYTLTALPDRLLVAGRFSSINSFARSSIAILSLNGTVDQSFQTPILRTASNGPGLVNRVLANTGRIVVGGDFTTPAHALTTLILEPTPQAPTLIMAPASRSVSIGAPTVLRAGISGWPHPTWQWSKDGVPIPGATREEFAIPACSLTDAGNYRLRATNASGTLTTSPATLSVAPRAWHGQHWRGYGPGSGTPLTTLENTLNISTITISDHIPIDRVVVRVDLSHEALDLLSVTLLPPPALSHPAIHLVNPGQGTRRRHLQGTRFDTASPLPFEGSPAPHRGTLQPDGVGLTYVNNRDASGVWTLVIEDHGLFDGVTGTLHSWSLEVLATPVPPTWPNWAADHGVATASSPRLDANRNGLPDLLDYALPNGAASTCECSRGNLLFTQRRWLDGGVSYEYLTSSNLRNWTPATPAIVHSLRPGDGSETVTLLLPPGGNFCRTRVSQNP